MSAPTHLDLFSGAGLFSAGLVQAGFEPVLAVELGAEAVASYRRNVSRCAVHGSVADFRGAPKVDVVIAGPPCQGFSTLGRRDPTDVRNALGLLILPWVRAADPSLVVIENVPPFLRSPQWRELAAGLRELGYADVVTWELDALDFGVPQRRRRAFTVASRLGPVAQPAPTTATPRTASSALFAPGLDKADPMHVWPTPKGIAADRIALIPPLGDKRDLLRGHPHLCPPSWSKIADQATDVWGRIDPDKPSNTVRCNFQNPSKGRYLHPTENRTLSLREGARLQGVPDSWCFEGKPLPAARQIGNGVPIPMAHAVGESLRAALAGMGVTALAA
ncbi:DNA (cytosine-5-)-methyltransferase [Methylobacterium fujisawaense]|uniref:DNA cytosine methyltransferase n=1 Tax=Methylobacterium fujisawaense TaxID=107400 RepID=UPI002F2C45E5